MGILKEMRGKESRGANLMTEGERRCSSYIYCLVDESLALKKGEKFLSILHRAAPWKSTTEIRGKFGFVSSKSQHNSMYFD